MSDAELVRVGAADGLPEQGSTTMTRVRAALPTARAVYAPAAVRVGPGIGVTYSGSGPTRITYHHAADFQLWVRFSNVANCPSTAAFVIDGHRQRVPVFAVYRHD